MKYSVEQTESGLFIVVRSLHQIFNYAYENAGDAEYLKEKLENNPDPPNTPNFQNVSSADEITIGGKVERPSKELHGLSFFCFVKKANEK